MTLNITQHPIVLTSSTVLVAILMNTFEAQGLKLSNHISSNKKSLLLEFSRLFQPKLPIFQVELPVYHQLSVVFNGIQPQGMSWESGFIQHCLRNKIGQLLFFLTSIEQLLCEQLEPNKRKRTGHVTDIPLSSDPRETLGFEISMTRTNPFTFSMNSMTLVIPSHFI